MLKFVKSLKSENVETLVFKPSDDDVLLPVEDDSLRGKWYISHTEFVCKLLQQKTELFFEFVKFSNLFLRNFGRMWIV